MAETLSVLVVDDEPGIRLGVSRVLAAHRARQLESGEEVGFTVTQAATGEEAVAVVEAAPPDILLLDHKLPGMSGLEVLESLSRKPRETLVVMITAYATIETAVLATRRGAYDFLAKPFTPDELRCTVSRAAAQLLLQRKARALAAERRQVRFEFVSVLAHELKAPLGAVEGYLGAIRKRLIDPGSPRYDEVLERCAVRIDGMKRMIAELQDLTKIESGKRKRVFVPVEVRALAQGALETVLPAAAARGVTLSLDAPEPVPITADPSEVEAILNNLLTNAVKYNRDGGRVDVKVGTGGGHVVIAVADTGVGLTPDEASRLFQEFVRIRNERTRGVPGTGLGLSIVKKLAQLMGGDVAVASEPGKGSTFTVRLPCGAEGA